MDVNRPCQSSQHGKVIKQVACPADPATMHGVGAGIVRMVQRSGYEVTITSSFTDLRTSPISRGRLPVAINWAMLFPTGTWRRSVVWCDVLGPWCRLHPRR